jgi:murein DD-endopeptidase MepM/ murein hydrolase activator NlpD
MSQKKNKIINWFKKGFQLIVYHGKSYDVLWKFRYNRLGFVFIILGINFFVFAIVSVFIIYTPIKRFIPGYPDKETRTLIYENAIRTDSLLKELEIREQYLEVVRQIILDEVPVDEEFVVPVHNLTQEQIKEFNNPTKSRKKVEDKTTHTVTKSDLMPQLFKPIAGIVVGHFDKTKSHFGVDIASNGQTSISAVLSGVVISSDYTIENGFTIIIQHKSEIISVYKHLSESMVRSGDFVQTGQAIGIYGNTGENTTGPHLHFELWRKGQALNPVDYIDFK